MRDIATTPLGTFSYAVPRRLPRRLVDRVVMARLRRRARAGAFECSGLARDWVRALMT